MSAEEINRELNEMSASGRISTNVAREAKEHPLHAEILIRQDRLERTNKAQSDDLGEVKTALFGNERLRIPGMVSDMKDLKYQVYHAGWTIAGGAAVGGICITALGLYIEWSKH